MTSPPPPPPICEASPVTPSDNGALANNGATPASSTHAVTPSLPGLPSLGPFQTGAPRCGSCTAGITTSSTYAPAGGDPLSSPSCTSVWTCLLASRDDWLHAPPEPWSVEPWRCSRPSRPPREPRQGIPESPLIETAPELNRQIPALPLVQRSVESIQRSPSPYLLPTRVCRTADLECLASTNAVFTTSSNPRSPLAGRAR